MSNLVRGWSRGAWYLCGCVQVVWTGSCGQLIPAWCDIDPVSVFRAAADAPGSRIGRRRSGHRARIWAEASGYGACGSAMAELRVRDGGACGARNVRCCDVVHPGLRQRTRAPVASPDSPGRATSCERCRLSNRARRVEWPPQWWAMAELPVIGRHYSFAHRTTSFDAATLLRGGDFCGDRLRPGGESLLRGQVRARPGARPLALPGRAAVSCETFGISGGVWGPAVRSNRLSCAPHRDSAF
ncbi:hypothetical protein BJ987_001132 [Nocardia goodfellowii]|uniref:Uncharacterized protein n=1 Tax=Nocardia goodfellowii TaxID=882446 RepID=A0ABS4QC16_9NOCA|nr:hypothetical protein [Nocardia goodfellowii]